MPTYNYRCEECSHTYKVEHSIHDEPEIYCPLCGGKCAVAILTPPASMLKGDWSNIGKDCMEYHDD